MIYLKNGFDGGENLEPMLNLDDILRQLREINSSLARIARAAEHKLVLVGVRKS